VTVTQIGGSNRCVIKQYCANIEVSETNIPTVVFNSLKTAHGGGILNCADAGSAVIDGLIR
jgi:hypothetical protein